MAGPVADLMPFSPSIAVITPLFNGAEYIAETIASLSGQLAERDEHIVVDDGSTDDGAQQVVALAASGAAPRLRLFCQANAGEALTVNRGVAESRADIIGVVNADDPIMAGLLDAVREAFSADPTLAAVYPDWIKIDQWGSPVATIRTLDYDYAVMVAQHMCIPGPGAFFRRSMLGSEPIRDPAAVGISDFDFWLRFGLHGAKVRRLPHALAYWRAHPRGATCAFQSPALARSKIDMIDRLFARSDVPLSVRTLERQAKSAAAYHAALVGLRSPNVSALRYALASFHLMPRWPAGVLAHQRRSLPHLAYAALQPASGALHYMIGPLLPARYRRQAVLEQKFGIDDPPSR
ncbi:MAG: glycosyltransferase [Phreatobacter sp.]|nr:glycosyltransferase [Phreatobacter sp.]